MSSAGADQPLPTRTVIAYGAASAPFEMIRAPALAILPVLYAKEYGFALTTVSLLMFWLRLSDAVMDPLVGYLSDRTRSRWGARKPWLFASIFVLVPAALVLYMPGEEASLWTFTIAYFFYFLGWAMFDIPYTAWGTEVATRYDDRSRLAVARGWFSSGGMVVLSLIPLLPFLSSTEMNFEALFVMGVVCAILYPAVIAVSLTMTPRGATVNAHSHSSIRETVLAIRRNPPLLIFIAIASISDLAIGIMGGMAFIFFDSYLGIGASFSAIFVSALFVSALSVKLWDAIVQRSSKRTLLLVCLAGGVFQSMLVMIMHPGPLALPIYIGFLTLFYVLAVGRDVAMYSMVGDIVDYDSLRTGGSRAGQFTSAWMVFRKFSYAIGPAIGLFVAGIAGYDPGAASNDALAIFGLKTANGYLPALLLGVAALLALRFPLTEARHRIIRRRLAQRAARESRAAELAASGR